MNPYTINMSDTGNGMYYKSTVNEDEANYYDLVTDEVIRGIDMRKVEEEYRTKYGKKMDSTTEIIDLTED